MIEDYIPAGIRQKILSSGLAPATLSTGRALYEHYRLSGLPFFREYTDHSFQHSMDVFKSACDMASEGAFEIISADDLNVLLLASLVHDSGLHVTEDVFLWLTDTSNSRIVVPEFDEKTWPELWVDFLAEAQRFNAKKLVSLFGDEEPVRHPPRSAIEMSQRDRLLIGEFLRRHHPRFAHEFIVGGIPDAKNGKFEFNEIEPQTRDIVGLIARSHGLDLRSTFAYIEKHYDLRDYNRIHIVYLMVLIRVADYLQIQSARAPALFRKLHTIKSPFSLGEWRLHQCIENVTTSAMDPEAVSVFVNPKSVNEYLRFENWMKGFQTEIDKSWAILGEVYGRFTREALNKLQLNVRRIRSNIEDKDSFQKRVRFVPESIRFSVSEPELLRLLMEPLYGENPTYGLRELTQNAVDSVNELEHLLKDDSSTIDRSSLLHDVEIEIVGAPDWSFMIRDRGTGMTLDTIKNYFLKAGASFRNSELWKQDFTDKTGKSQVARTGRFGVGALSAYLIGEKVQIFTRHYAEKSGYGYSFQCSIDDEEIEITQKKGQVGTTIAIWSTERKIVLLERYLATKSSRPFFYISNKPTVGLGFSGDFPEPPKLPDWEEGIREISQVALAKPAKWILAGQDKYEKIEWDRTVRQGNFRGTYRQLSGYLYSNGILVGDVMQPASNLILDTRSYGLLEVSPAPTVSIIDHNAYLPVDLARKGLSRPDLELSEAVKKSVYMQLLAELISGKYDSPSSLIEWWEKSDFPVTTGGWIPFLFHKDGFCLLDRTMIHTLAPKRFIVQRSETTNLEKQLSDGFCDAETCIALRRHFSSSKTAILQQLQETYFQTNLPIFESPGKFREFSYFENQYFVFESEVFSSLFALASAPNYLKKLKETSLSFKARGTDFLIVSRNAEVSGRDIKEFSKFFKRTFQATGDQALARDPTILWENYSSPYNERSLFSEVWNLCFDVPFLPYNYKERYIALKNGAPISFHS